MNKDIVYDKKKNIVYNKKYPTVVLVEAVTPLDDFRVHVRFTDNVEKEIDLKPVIRGPVFERIRNDPAFFRQVYVDSLSKTLTWPNGVDLDPESLYYGDEMPPWWKDYYAREEKKKARTLRERRLKAKRAPAANGRRKTTKAPAPKKRTTKARSPKVVAAKRAPAKK